MPRTNTTTVTVQRREGSEQYFVTIPRAFGDMLDLDGQWVSWVLTSADRFELPVSNSDPEKANSTKVSKKSNGQYRTTLPAALGAGLEMDGKKLDWSPASGSTLEVRIRD